MLEGAISMTIYLYKKTHNKTGMQYLGKTKQDPFKYKGSGLVWQEHINEHGTDISTEILRECSSPEELSHWGRYYSKLWNVVESSEWANKIPETGGGGGGVPGVPLSEETKEKIRKNKPDQSGDKNGMFGKTHSKEAKIKCGGSNRGKDIKTTQGKENIKNSIKNQWKDPIYREKMINSMKNRKGEKRSPAAIEAYKLSAKRRIEAMTPEQRSEISKKGAITRKNNYAGLRRKKIIDEEGKVRFIYIPAQSS